MRRAAVPARSARQVAADLMAALEPPGDSLVIAFVSSQLDPDAVAGELHRAAGSATVVGCTSAGEIGGAVASSTAVALMLSTEAVRFGVGVAELTRRPLQAGRAAVTAAAIALGHEPHALEPARHVALTLVDGRSAHAEGFCLGTAATAPQIGFVGGSSSDQIGGPPRSALFFGGRAHREAGAVILLEPRMAFSVLMSEHMTPTGARTVVTGADPSRRVIHELDGYPAVSRYHQLLREFGVDAVPDSAMASSFPFAVYIDGQPYVRSVKEVAGEELHLAAVVDEGAVLRIMRPGDLVAETRSAFEAVRGRVGELAAVIAFSCCGRHNEAQSRGSVAALDEIYASVPVVGFHSFGEQSGPLLVNHTLAALALGGTRA